MSKISRLSAMLAVTLVAFAAFAAEPLELFDPPRAVLLDDFEVTTDESCPTQTE